MKLKFTLYFLWRAAPSVLNREIHPARANTLAGLDARGARRRSRWRRTRRLSRRPPVGPRAPKRLDEHVASEGVVGVSSRGPTSAEQRRASSLNQPRDHGAARRHEIGRGGFSRGEGRVPRTRYRPWQAHDVRSKGADGAHPGSKCFDGTEDAQQLN